jgi:hypothetical protein
MMANETSTRVTILTSSYRIKGNIDLLPGSRLTDYMAGAKQFIAVTSAEVYELEIGGQRLMAVPFLNVSIQHIQVIAPEG